jgi:hypothetical protein
METKPGHVVKPLELVCQRNLEKFGEAVKGFLECCTWMLMGNSGGWSEDQNIIGMLIIETGFICR